MTIIHSSFAKVLWASLILVCLLSSCGDDPVAPAENNPLPKITWVMSSGRFRIQTGESIQLVPDIEYLDETSVYTWLIEGRVVGHDTYYTFTTNVAGEYFVKLVITNRYGQTEDEVKITVVEAEQTVLPEIPEHSGWRYPWSGINVAEGRTINVVAYMDGRKLSSVFEATGQGTHKVMLTDEVTGQQQEFNIYVCPPAGTYRRSSQGQAMVNRVYAYMPAPGHQVNGYIITGKGYPDDCTHEQACDSVLAHFARKWSVSLGGQGGYLIAGFDHSVPNGDMANGKTANDKSSYDLCIKGNPFSYQSEPGIIWVSQDVNGDGLPNDQWFELAGSEYGTDNHNTEYAITYFRPDMKKSAVGWRDSNNDTGYIPYMSYWNPSAYYWQSWQKETSEMTFFGSRLRDRSTYEQGISDIPPYEWGYVDNLSDIDFIEGPAGKMNYFKISNARTWDGQPANLEYIDFVKVQTAQTGSTPNLGEISTEVYYIGDCHLE